MSYKQSLCYGAAIGALLGAALLAPGQAAAQSNQDLSLQVDQLRQQVQQLQQQLQNAPPPAAGPVAPGSEVSQTNGAAPLPRGAVQLGGVRLQLGGFIESAGIWRSRNEVSDVGSDYNTGIPFNSSVQAHQNEFRKSARQSRIAGLATGNVNDDTHLAAYFETDFLSAAATSNSRESNSYSLRVRHAYITLDEDGWGLHILAGQSWSLLTTNTAGIIPRQEQVPLTIDAQYVVGFNWKRQAQVRIVKNWGNLWAGVSFENPEFNTASTTPSGVNVNNSGDAGGLENNSTTYSNNFMPDIVGKVAIDPGWGHYELKSIVRGFSSTLAGTTGRALGYAGGAAATMPIVPKFVDLQLSGLAGYGIGTYGSGQLPERRLQPQQRGGGGPRGAGAGRPDLPSLGRQRPLSLWRLGACRPRRRTDHLGLWLGQPGPSGCNTLGASCAAETQDLKQAVIGTWQNVYKGNFGRFVVGLQGTYDRARRVQRRRRFADHQRDHRDDLDPLLSVLRIA